MKKRYLFFLFFCFAISNKLQAQTPDANGRVYVNINMANGTGNSWASPTKQLADALLSAKTNTNIKQIWVAKGTYKPLYNPADANFGTNQGRDNAFLMVNDVKVYGGFVGTTETAITERDLTNTANKTILSGDVQGDDQITGTGATLSITGNTENNYHVVISAGAIGLAELNGFTISGGNANGVVAFGIYGLTVSKFSGGGMYNTSSSPVLTNVIFSSNSAGGNGGGMSNIHSSSPVLTNVTLMGNSASNSSAGGMYNINYSSPVLTNVTLIGNTATINGGGMVNSNGSSPVLTNVTLSGNKASSGGGMYNSVSSPVLTNVTLSGNNATSNGGGMFNDTSNPKIYNSLIFGNKVGATADNILNGNSTPDIQYSLVEGLTTTSNGNIDATGITLANIFTDATNGNYTLKAFSPAINKGSNTLYTGLTATTTDLAGNLRLQKSTIDMGAYESIYNTITPDANGKVYVVKNATGDGSSWTNATAELADALVSAKTNTNIKQIWVAKGTYKPLYSPQDGANFGTPQGRDNAFLMVNDVKVYGGFVGTTETSITNRDLTNTANKTILSGDVLGDDSGFTNNTDNNYHVVISADVVGTAELNGFTISGGNANGPGTNITVNGKSIRNDNAGGMYNATSSPVLTNVTLSGNTTTGYGGGMYNTSSSPVLTNVTLSGNTTTGYGGGMYNTSSSPVLTNVTLSGNTASGDGGGMVNASSSPVLTNVMLSGNTSTGYGGGMFNIDISSPVLSNVTLSSNTAHNGGAMFNTNSSNPVLSNVTLVGNTASLGGGMVNVSSSPVLTNVTLRGNTATYGSGGGMSNSSSSSPVLTNVTLSGNTATGYGGGMYNLSSSNPKIYNSLIFGNKVGATADNINNDPNSTPDIQYSLVEGLTTTSNGNLSATGITLANIFTDATNGNYTLKAFSPAINKGSNTLYTGLTATTTDLAGNLRLQKSTIDMGAYESIYNTITPDANGKVYVVKNATGDGISWTNATAELADALVSAKTNTNIKQIWVAKGTYKPLYSPQDGANFGTPQGRDNAFLMVNDVKVYGGFVGTTETDISQRLPFTAGGTGGGTILSGDVQGDDSGFTNNTENNYHVVISVGTIGLAELNGFTISGGNADGLGTNITVNGVSTDKSYGGGMFNTDTSSPVLTNLTLSGNTARGNGGGMYNANSSSPVLTNVTLSGNSATNSSGGGMFNTNSSSPVLTNVTLSGNTATHGGGMFNANSSSPVLTNVTFSSNTANLKGGGMYNNISSSPVLTNVMLVGNTAVTGGGMYNNSSSPVLTNVTLSGNTATVSGGGMYNYSSSSPILTNVTLVGNTATNDGGGMFNLSSSTPKIYNSLIFGNKKGATADNILNGNSTPDIQYSLVEGLTTTSNGNLSATGITLANIFTDATNGNYTLKAFSPAINKGSNTLYTGLTATTTDLAGNLRLQKSTIDMGAYESIYNTITPDANGKVYVVKNATGDGSSWTNATAELADALVSAKTNTNIKQIWVAKGTYKPLYSPEDGANFGTPQGRDNAFLMVNDVKVYGGFVGTTETAITDRDLTNTANKTTLSADVQGDDQITGTGATLSITGNTENNYHVVISAGAIGTAELNGFTISGGNADGSGTNITVNGVSTYNSYGGGMLNTDTSSPVLTNVTLSGNTARGEGGGMYNNSSSPVLSNVTLSGNTVPQGHGGGMYNSSSSPVLSNVTLSGNRANAYGGGIANGNSSSPVLTNVTLSGNTAGNGGGMMNWSSSPILSNVTLNGNTTFSGGGGGMYNYTSSPVLTNVTFVGNIARTSGGGMNNWFSSAPVLINVTIVGNTATNGGGGMFNDTSNPKIYNSLIFGNKVGATADNILNNGANSALDIQYSLVEGLSTTSNGNLSATGITLANIFTDATNGNYTLNGGSPAINKGSNTLYTGLTATTTDLAGNLRLQKSTIDMGAYESIYSTITPDANGKVYVVKNATGDGSSWTNATAELADALVSAKTNTNIKQIWVAKGTYKPLYSPQDGANFGTPQGRDNAFLMVNDVKVYGGFVGTTETAITERDLTNTANKTILTGDVLGDDQITGTGATLSITGNTENNYHVVISVGAIGLAELNGFTISGGNANGPGTTITVNNIMIYKSTGGAMFNVTSSPVLSNVTLSGNNASSAGGGMYNINSSSPVLTNVVLNGNTAGSNGGGMYNINSSSPVLTNVTIVANTATNIGGGGGMDNYNSSNPKIYNSLIFGNKKGATADNIDNTNSTPAIQYSLVEGLNATSNGNIDATGITLANIFTDATNGNYTLKAFSPAINKGNNTLYTGLTATTTDLAGNLRLQKSTIDMGAYESIYNTITPDANGKVYVVKNATGDGSSWTNATAELADALLSAKTNTNIKQIWVAKGTYKPLYSPQDGANFGTPQGRDNAFLMVNDVKVYGGFVGTETAITDRDLTNTANKTILSGDVLGDDSGFTNNTENNYHVVISAGAIGLAELNGFTISGGNANGNSNSITVNGLVIWNPNAGGMYNITSSPVLTNVTLSGNTASSGGGMYNRSSSPVLTNVTLSGNTANFNGGGMYNEISSSPVLSNVTLSGNTAGGSGGGMGNYFSSSPILSNVTLSGNTATNGNAGGMYNQSSSPVLSNVTLSGNTATNANAGGMYNGTSSPVLTNVTLSGNTASNNGGGMYNDTSSPVLTNVTLSGNTGLYNGGGMYNGGSSPVLTNVTLVGNTATNNGGGMYNNNSSNLKIYNSLIFGNKKGATADNILNSNSTPDIQYSLVEGLSTTSNGNISATGITLANIFTDATNGNYTLKVFSPAINKGSNTLYTGLTATTTDLAGNLRLQKSTIDMGAYESIYNAITPDANGKVYVVKNATGDGSSWTNATAELADALVSAKTNTNIKQIWVAKGTYKPLYSPQDGANFGTPQGRDNAFLMVNDVKVYGGFVGTETDINQRAPFPAGGTAGGTILTADVQGDDQITGTGATLSITGNTENNYHVVISANAVGLAELNGFTISGGNANDNVNNITVNGVSTYKTFAGGMYNINSSPVLSNVALSGNTANGNGGGMYNANSSSPVLSNVTLSGNSTNGSGGGMFNTTSSPILTNVTLSGNTATNGGGMFNANSSSPVLSTVTFIGNTANLKGAGMFNNSSSPVLTNVMLVGNTAVTGGGMFNANSSSPVLTNVTLVGNTASSNGGGMFNDTSNPKIYNSLIFGNKKGASSNNIDNINSTPTIKYSLVEGLTTTSNGNIDATGITLANIFTDATTGNYTLNSGSPAINKGSNSFYASGLIPDLSAITTDIAGNQRFIGTAIDMGAYESQSQAQTISPIANITKTYGDADFEPGATATSGLTVSYTSADNTIAQAYQDVADNNKWKIKILKAGTVNITASQAGNGNYNPASDVVFSLVINKKALTLSFAPTLVTKVYDGTTTATVSASNLAFATGAIVGADDVSVTLANTNAVYVTPNAGTGINVSISLANISLSGTSANNYSIANTVDVSANVGEITKATITGISLAGGIFTYDGTAKSLAISGTLPTGATVSYTGNAQTSAGTYPVTATITGGTNYADLVLPQATLTIDKASITGISFAGATFTYDGTAKSLAISGTLPTGATVSYTGNAQTSAGAYPVTATITGGANYADLVLPQATLTIDKASITGISFAGATFTYDGTAKSLAISGTLPTGATVSYTGNAQTSAGTYPVTATITGGTNYADLVLPQATLTIDKASITGISFAGATFTYDGTAKSLAISGTLPTGATVSYTGNAQTSAGAYPVTATITGGTNYADLVLPQVMLTIDKASITGISLAGATFTYDGTAKSLAISGTLPTGAMVSYTGNAQTSAGAYPVTATITGGTNYADLVLPQATLTINKASITVTADAKGKGYGNADPALTYTFSPALQTGDSFTGALSRATGESVGTYAINQNTLLAGGNYAITYTSALLTINKASITVTADAKNKGYGNADPALTYTFSPSLQTGDSFTGALSRATGESVGTYAISQNTLSAGGNYAITYTSALLTINKASITGISLAGATFTYDGTAKSLAISGTLPTGATVSYTGNAQTSAGAYPVKATITGGTNYADLVLPQATLTINKASITGISLAGATFTYDGTAKSLAITGTLPTGATVSYTGNAQTSAGAYPVTATIAGGANYADLVLPQAMLTINKASITGISLAGGTFTYDGTAKSLAISGTLPTGATVSYTGNAQTSAGAYPVTATITGGTNYADLVLPQVTLTINKASITVTADNKQMCQGTSFPSFTFTYTGFVNSDNASSLSTKPTVTTNASSNSVAGNYVLTASGGVSGNYSFNYVNGNLTINAKPSPVITSNKGNDVSKGETVVLTASGGTSYVWSTADGIISGINTAVLTVRPNTTTTYTVTASNSTSCSETASYTITVRDDFQVVKANNILTPNGDGMNDLWVVENIDMYPNNVVTIVDKAGRVLYTKKGYNNTWDGTVNGMPLAENTYYYVIDFGTNKLKQKGFITIVRN